MKTTMMAAVLAAACAGACAQAPPKLYLATEATPYVVRDGGPAGDVGTDMVREIMARTGTAHAIEPLPWKRAYTAALQRGDACVFPTTRTPDREARFQWVGPIGEAEWVLMGRADRQYGLRTLDDARGYRIGTYHGDARDQYLRARGFQVDRAPNDAANPRKLMMGRIDLWAASMRHTGPTLARLGYTGRIVPVLAFNRVQVYLACNRAVPEALVARMNAAAQAMERDGTARAIGQRYEGWGALRQNWK